MSGHMDGGTGTGGLTPDEISGVVAAHGRSADLPTGGAVIVALVDPLRVVWANRAATQLIGTADPVAFSERMFGRPGRDGLRRVVLGLVLEGGARTERLRIFRGFRARTVPVSLSRSLLSGGQEVVVVAVPTGGLADGEDSFATDALQWPTPFPEPQRDGPADQPLPPRLGPTLGGQRRFLWQTDLEHRLSGPLDPGPDLAGPDRTDRGAGTLPALLAGLGIASETDLGTVLGQAQAFHGWDCRWPLADGTGTVAVVLGGVPMRGQGGAFAGFRGFGLADFARVLPAPALSEPAPAAARLAPMVAAPEKPQPAPDIAPARIGVRASFSSAKIVALRPSKLSTGGGETIGLPARRLHDAPAPPSPNLSTVEQLNFDEIARALRGGVETADDARAAEPGDDGAAILGALPVPLLIECKGRIVYANTAFLELTGYASARAIDRAGGRRYILGGLDAAQVAGADQDRAFPIIGASGEVIPFEGRLAVIAWSGASAEMMTLRPAQDRAAERHALQAELQRGQAELAEGRALLDRTADAALVVDGQGRLLAVNTAAERMFGRDRASLVGESIGAFLSLEGQNAALGAVFAAGAAGPAAAEAHLEVAGRRRDGSPALLLHMSLRALEPGKVGVILQDETDRQAMRETLARLRAEKDESGVIRSALLAKVSHEVRTPLNSMIGFAEIMLEERLGPLGHPRYKEYLTDIMASGKHVIDLITDISDLSAMQAGRHDLAVIATDVNGIVSQRVAGLQASAHRDRVIVRLSLLPQLPSAMVDERAFRQAMDSILSNAIRFNEPGGQVIVSTALAEGGGIAVRVRDTGVGMSDEELAVALEPFRQFSTDKPGSGSGMGLPLTRALIEANEATLSIRSRKGEGTLVEIVLRPAAGQPLSAPAA